jgi:cysteine desulfurase
MNAQKSTYLDHNATTPMKPEAREIMLETLGFAGNPSSVHKAGRDSRRRIEESRTLLSQLTGAGKRSAAVFTSGATEANNLVLKGSGSERNLVSAVEHVSVLNALNGSEVIPVLPTGLVDLAALEKMLAGTDRSTLVSVMYVNNETGVIQPVEKISALARKHGALLHVDAVQALGRVPVDMHKSGIDYLTLSAHKIGGPQGAGALVMANCVAVAPQISGGNQEKSMRAGTENVAGIAAFAKAAELAVRDMEKFQALSVLRDRLETGLRETAPDLKIFGADAPRAANTTMFALPGLPSETQLIALDLAGICVSNGSACSSGTVKPSHVLKAMGAGAEEINSSLRVSLGWNTTEGDIDYFLEKWREMYERIKSRNAP